MKNKISSFSNLLTWNFFALVHTAERFKPWPEQDLFKVGKQNYALFQMRSLPVLCTVTSPLLCHCAESSHEVLLLPSPPAPLFFPTNELPTCMRNFCCSACHCTLCFSHFCLTSPQGEADLCLSTSLFLHWQCFLCHQSTSIADSYFYVKISHENIK